MADIEVTEQAAVETGERSRLASFAFYQGRHIRSYRTLSHGDGIRVFDTEGRPYIDGSSGAIVSNLGHGNTAVLEAMAEQARTLAYAARTDFSNIPKEELLHALTQAAGAPFDQALFVSGGSEAIDTAIKLARQYKAVIGEETRWKVLSRMPSYHGSTIGATAVTGDPARERLFHPLSPVMPKVPTPFTYRVPNGMVPSDYADFCTSALERQIIDEGPETVLAFIVEPVGGLATGALVTDEPYLRKVRRICSQYGVLLIFDEVVTGCGRTGKYLASHHWPDARPDLIALAKGLGAGYTPIGAVLAPNVIVDAVAESGGFAHGFTHSGNPLSCAVALAVIREIDRWDLTRRAVVAGELLRSGLRELMLESRTIGDVRGIGCLNAVEIVADRETKASFDHQVNASARLKAIGLDVGLHLYARRSADGLFGEWLMACPPLIISDDEVADYVGRFGEMISIFEREVDG